MMSSDSRFALIPLSWETVNFMTQIGEQYAYSLSRVFAVDFGATSGESRRYTYQGTVY